MSETTVPTAQDAKEESSSNKRPIFQMIGAYIRRRIEVLRQSIYPQPNYLEEEEVKQTIRMASYRATLPRVLSILGAVMLFLTSPVFIYMMMFDDSDNRIIAGALVCTSLYILYKAAQTWIAYNQWQFIITNKRIIITTPDPDHYMFADIIYLQIQSNSIKVLDTNLSENPLWRLLQISSGTRDVVLSPGGYEFMKTGAKVKDGLRFPDVPQEDAKQLERLIFGG